MSFPDYRDLRDKSRSFSGLAAYRLTTLAAAANPRGAGADSLCEPGQRQLLSGGRSDACRRPRVSARGSDCAAQPVAMISYDFWQQNYAGDQSAIGSSLRLNGIVFTIIGVTPESFTGLDRFLRPSIFVPLGMAQRLDGDRRIRWRTAGATIWWSRARLSAGASRESAQAELATIGAALEREYPKTNRNRHMAVRTELQRRIQQTPQLLALVKMLMGLVALILIIACSNVANLLLARARARSREIAIRLSIGAGRRPRGAPIDDRESHRGDGGRRRGTVLRLRRHPAAANAQRAQRSAESCWASQLDWRVVEFSLLAALASCLFFGLAPAWQTARTDFVSALKAGGDGASGKRRTLGRDVLVAGQIALAMVVLIAAGMFLAGFRNMLVMPPEFRTDHLISLDTAPAMLHYSPEQTKAFYRRLVDRVRTMAGVAGVAMTESLPLSPSQTVITVVPEGYQFPKGREKTIEFGAAVDAGYFSTLNVEITTRARLHGRRPRRIAPRGDCEPAVRQDLLAGPGSDWKADPAGQRGRPGCRGCGSGQDRALSGRERGAGAVTCMCPTSRTRAPRMTLVVQSAGDAGALATALARGGSIDRRQRAGIQPADRSDALRKPRDGYVAAVLPDGGDHGIHRPGAGHHRALWADRLHGEPPREGVRHPRRRWREPPRRGLAGRAPRADSRGRRLSRSAECSRRWRYPCSPRAFPGSAYRRPRCTLWFRWRC